MSNVRKTDKVNEAMSMTTGLNPPVDSAAAGSLVLIPAIEGIVAAWGGGDLAGAVNKARMVAEDAKLNRPEGTLPTPSVARHGVIAMHVFDGGATAYRLLCAQGEAGFAALDDAEIVDVAKQFGCDFDPGCESLTFTDDTTEDFLVDLSAHSRAVRPHGGL